MGAPMITDTPIWTCSARHSLKRAYGHVALMDQLVLGQWICLNRCDGRLLWERRFLRADTIVGVADDVIVASENRSDGPWTVDFGCYGISLQTGELLWVSHRNGIWGKIVRLFDYVPGFTNDLRDTAVAIRNGEVFCRSGRVLDIKTGKFLRRIRRADIPSHIWWGHRRLLDSALRFPREGESPPEPVRVADDCYVSRFPPQGVQRKIEPLEESDNASLYGTAADGTLKWQFRVSHAGYHSGSYPFRYLSPYFYFVVSDAPVTLPIRDDNPYVVRRNPGNWHALTLDARTGSVIQDVLLGHCEWEACIEDLDDNAVLFSIDGRSLAYHPRIKS